MGSLKEKFLSRAYAKYYSSKIDSAIGSSCASNFIKSENISKLRRKNLSPPAVFDTLMIDDNIKKSTDLFYELSSVQKFLKAFRHFSKAVNKDANFLKFHDNSIKCLNKITGLGDKEVVKIRFQLVIA